MCGCIYIYIYFYVFGACIGFRVSSSIHRSYLGFGVSEFGFQGSSFGVAWLYWVI